MIVRGRMVELDRDDVDTDAIMPRRFVTGGRRSGFGSAVFYHWRRSGQIALDDPARAGAKVLVAADNFGIGSAREHAVWGLRDWGFAAVVAVRFGDIFRSNCISNGVVPAAVDTRSCALLRAIAARDPAAEAVVDVLAGELWAGDLRVSFILEPISRRRLTESLDEVALTLTLEDRIAHHEATRARWMPMTPPRKKGG